MIDTELHLLLLIMLVGATIVFSILIKAGLERIGVSSLIGYLVLGFLFRLLDERWGILSEEAHLTYEFLADIGVIVLLFRVGLESNLVGLLSQFRRAIGIWIGDIVASGFLGYVFSYYLLGLPLVPSLFVAVALSVTSVSVSIGVWQEAKAINSSNGELLLDVAEMDDISGLVLMALLFAMIPALMGSTEAFLLPVIAKAGGLVLLSIIGFGTFCLLFSLYIEKPLTNFFRRIEPAPAPMLMVTGIGFVMAALAGLLGFSLAIGAFFGGLVFSRDPEAVKMETSFGAIYELFSPFFFIGIGLQFDPHTLSSALGLGAIIMIAAVLGKIIGAGGATLITAGWTSAVVLGISMVPRAEIAMIIMHHGLKLGDWAVSSQVFSAMVLVSAGTCLFTPLLLRPLLRRWPQTEGTL